MVPSGDILVNSLRLDRKRADDLVAAIRTVGARNSAGWISISDLVEESGEPVDVVRDAVSALLLAFRLVARFEPYHRFCERPIGPSEESQTRIEEKLSDEEYPRLCRHCGEPVESMADIIVRVLAYLPEGGL